MNFDDDILSCHVDISPDYSQLKVRGYVKSSGSYKEMYIIAANPIDRMTNYSGSGLPFPCSTIAFENTPNKCYVGFNGEFNCVFAYPNSFYAQNGRDKIVSSIFFDAITVNDESVVRRYELPDVCVLRTLVNRSARKSPEFYAAKDYVLPIATAENVMRAYAQAKVENDIG
jgi:hypothetical protein